MKLAALTRVTMRATERTTLEFLSLAPSLPNKTLPHLALTLLELHTSDLVPLDFLLKFGSCVVHQRHLAAGRVLRLTPQACNQQPQQPRQQQQPYKTPSQAFGALQTY